MNVERGVFDNEETPEQAAALDERIAAIANAAVRYGAAFAPERDAERMAKAEADVAAGHVYSNEEVIAWLKTWGASDATPFPRRWSE
jgi:predicted transcriptional regulator